jgi:hypothetical protein
MKNIHCLYNYDGAIICLVAFMLNIYATNRHNQTANTDSFSILLKTSDF